MNSPLMTATEVADFLRLDIQTIRAWCRSGKLKAVKLGKDWKIDKDDVDDFLARARKEAK